MFKQRVRKSGRVCSACMRKHSQLEWTSFQLPAQTEAQSPRQPQDAQPEWGRSETFGIMWAEAHARSKIPLLPCCRKGRGGGFYRVSECMAQLGATVSMRWEGRLGHHATFFAFRVPDTAHFRKLYSCGTSVSMCCDATDLRQRLVRKALH